MKRQIGFWSATFLVVANMVGSAVFVASGSALVNLGSRTTVLWAWALGGVLAMFGALSYGGLALRFPESGGEYEYLRRAWHPLLGFLGGWVSLIVGFSAPIAFSAAAMQHYLAPALGSPFGAQWLGTLAILLAGAAHCVGVRSGARFQNGIVIVKLIFIVALIVGGGIALLSSGSAAAPPRPVPDEGVASVSAFAVSLVWIYFGYSGWNAAVYVGSEVERPERNLPRSLVVGTLLVIALYLGLNAVFVHAAPFAEVTQQKEVIGVVAGRALGGELLGTAIGVLVAVALFTSVSAMIMAGPRVYAKMADDGVFPAWFSTRDGPPRASIALQIAIALAFLWTIDLDALMTYIGYTLSLSTGLTVLGIFVVRRREGPHAVRVFGYPWVPGAYVVAVLAIAVFSFLQVPAEASLALASLLIAVPLYYWFRRARR